MEQNIDKKKQGPHLFDGMEGLDRPCGKCGEKDRVGNHIRNGGKVCDTSEGPCSCGAWH